MRVVQERAEFAGNTAVEQLLGCFIDVARLDQRVLRIDEWSKLRTSQVCQND